MFHASKFVYGVMGRLFSLEFARINKLSLILLVTTEQSGQSATVDSNHLIHYHFERNPCILT